ncbi:MAG: hypothetical protein ACLRZ9_05415 [Eubacterium sp.]
MDDKIQYWSQKYKINNLKVVGYGGGYPIIQFDRDENMPVLKMSQREIEKILRRAEASGGMELGVGWNFRKTTFVRINNETIVICGHENVLDKVLEKLF